MFKKIAKSFLAASAVLSVAVGTVTAGAQSVEIDPSVEQKLKIMTIGELATLDSAVYNDTPSSDMIGQVFEGLYRVSSGTEVELGQAESVDISEDGLVYTFKLREGLKWSNGEPVTAEDFVYSYQRLVDPNGSSSSKSVEIFKNAAAIRNGEKELSELGVKALDDLTVEITLEYPAPYLPKLLTGSRFMPVSKAFVEEKGEAYGTSADNIVTNGPFTLSNWSGTELEWNLTKNEQYWDAENVYLNEVLVSVVKETGTAADLYDAGELDYAILSDQFVSQYQESEDFNTIPRATLGYIMFNDTRETTSNAALRRAISQAFDKELYATSVIQDGSKAANGFVPTGFDVNEEGVDYREAAGQILPYNVEKAQADWEQAKKELGVEELSLELLVSDVDLSGRTAEYLQAQIQENLPGLTLTIRSVPLQNRLEFQRNREYDFYYGTWAPDYQDAMNFIEQLQTGGGINFAEYSNEKVDQLISQARNEFANDPAKRREALIAAEKIMVEEDAVVSALYQVSTSFLLSPDVKNFEILPFGRTINLRTTYRTGQ
ncbi:MULTISPECIES: peptide ABC transporter substrate-binding protein [unclassified Facklamia]|uniref:peptide ABC transporter substrate-binding protein n=1 Tax=Aerococcaceae TaxID=186827 RepID=UPI0013B9BB06|nr:MULTISPECIES: peptide ABC transporter substrate-binding protein [unclassified Facklamia]NEW63697.1 peptide ABC transporter substrate-binding protein [Facklamia sp. 252]NEW67168.1 peptide ABC transporter substrate-binding protein [Facklamia sp. 253]QQD66292.1 peptide ABC transporter substrate-binding protein [Aerococcaceae bacterium zg-252]